MTDEELQHLLVLDGAPGPALAIDAAYADAIVDAALTGAGFGLGGPGSPGGGSAGGAAADGGAGATAGAGATTGAGKLVLIGGALAIAIVVALLARGLRGGRPQVATLPADAAIDAPIGTGSAVAAEGPSRVDTTGSTIAPAPHVDMTDEQPPVVDMTDVPPRRTTPAPTRDPVPTREPAPAATSPTDLLAEANAKRAAKEWRASDALYARVVERAPKSLAAQTALVASAALHLEHLADPKGAAQRFRRALALAPRGALAEEARWGLAEAARATRDTAAEKAALDDFLAHHASSPLAPRAKARRAELP